MARRRPEFVEIVEFQDILKELVAARPALFRALDPNTIALYGSNEPMNPDDLLQQ